MKKKPKIGIRLTLHGTYLTFLSFADDTFISAPSTISSINKIKEILVDLLFISGLKINYQKSTFQLSVNISQIDTNILASRMHIPITNSLETYFGIPIISTW